MNTTTNPTRRPGLRPARRARPNSPSSFSFVPMRRLVPAQVRADTEPTVLDRARLIGGELCEEAVETFVRADETLVYYTGAILLSLGVVCINWFIVGTLLFESVPFWVLLALIVGGVSFCIIGCQKINVQRALTNRQRAAILALGGNAYRVEHGEEFGARL